jgi:hypothetical protein
MAQGPVESLLFAHCKARDYGLILFVM